MKIEIYVNVLYDIFVCERVQIAVESNAEFIHTLYIYGDYYLYSIITRREHYIITINRLLLIIFFDFRRAFIRLYLRAPGRFYVPKHILAYHRCT